MPLCLRFPLCDVEVALPTVFVAWHCPTECHTRDARNSRNLLGVWRPEARYRVSRGHGPSEAPGRTVLASLLLVILGLGDTSLQSPPLPPRGLLPISVFTRHSPLHIGHQPRRIGPLCWPHLNQLTSACVDSGQNRPRPLVNAE